MNRTPKLFDTSLSPAIRSDSPEQIGFRVKTSWFGSTVSFRERRGNCYDTPLTCGCTDSLHLAGNRGAANVLSARPGPLHGRDEVRDCGGPPVSRLSSRCTHSGRG